MAGNYCEQFKELLDKIPGELDKARDRCIRAVLNGPFGDENSSVSKNNDPAEHQAAYDMVARWFDHIAKQIAEVKDYIKNDVLPWAMAPLALEDSSSRYLKLAENLQNTKGTASAGDPGWGSNVEWTGTGANAYLQGENSVINLQRKGIEASADMADQLSKALDIASQKRFTFLIETVAKLGELLVKVISEFTSAGNFMAAIRLIFSFSNVIQTILNALIAVTANYAKLCADSLSAAKEITRATFSARGLPGDGWPPARSITDAPPGERGWDEK